MKRRRMINRIRTDSLELKIAHYRALGNYDAAAAIEALAHSISAPISEEEIAREAKARRRFYNGE